MIRAATALIAALWILGSVLYWARLTPGVSALVLAWSVAWSALPSIPWPPELAWMYGGDESPVSDPVGRYSLSSGPPSEQRA